jgi:hypothetical protein
MGNGRIATKLSQRSNADHRRGRMGKPAPSGAFGRMIFRVQFLDGSARVIAQWSA